MRLTDLFDHTAITWSSCRRQLAFALELSTVIAGWNEKRSNILLQILAQACSIAHPSCCVERQAY